VLREADRIVRQAGRRKLTRPDVEAAIRARRSRHDLAERRTQDLLDDGIVLLETTGKRIGQVNALPVYDLGDHVFARPARVTASVALGRAGVVDIEREAQLSGETHHKGLEIVAGLLRERYAQEKPLALTASVCFEQSYARIDGDSASVAEVVAILSALARVGVDQGFAVTGSCSQKGDVQAVGDANEKVEGFFDACLARGLTGGQGVLVPLANVPDLMLKEEVVEAVRAGRFHVHAISSVDEALLLLTGLQAGVRGADGRYPAGFLNALVDERLRAFAEAARRYESGRA
jgi:predicted ATP-dependent protease